MAETSFEAYGSGDAMFCVIVLWLSVVSIVIFSCVDHRENSASSSKRLRRTAAARRGDGSYLSF
ncbi:hypothetical protein HPP92_019188 [Vanilla planifolia]|uniref:Uncharacterized protein n=1 Tax=Vanilla planifolia TaxID=51239 RepID=A0A835UJ37_VANPL|nr:hypothetical protein HPP92_019188 [Vanilla planifolia]